MNATIIAIILASICLSVFAIFMVSFLIFHNKKMIQNKDEIQQLELDKAKKILIDSIQVQETERARIGRDIHDDLGPNISAMKLKINNLSSEKMTSERDISLLKMMVDETMKSIRTVSHSLYPNTLEKFGLKSAIEEMANRFKTEELKVITDIDPFIDTLEFSSRINIYRILQEFCNNSIKYGQCDTIQITISKNDGPKIIICAQDNGVGFDTSDTANHGIGIRNMKMRSEAINFDFDLFSNVGEGTKITLSSTQGL